MKKQLLKWHRDKNGHIVKGNDHHPDTIICAMMHEFIIMDDDMDLSRNPDRLIDRGGGGGGGDGDSNLGSQRGFPF